MSNQLTFAIAMVVLVGLLFVVERFVALRRVELNEAGEFPLGDPTDLEAGANRCAVA